MSLSIYNIISIIQLVFFVPALVISLLLSYRHGLKRSAGWIYLVILSLMRIIGAGLELGTINDPDNINLITGAEVLQNIGLSPLILILLGLVTRVYTSMPETRRPGIPNARILRIMQLVVVVGLILSIVGGTSMSSQVGDELSNGEPVSYSVADTSKAGVILMIIGYVLVLISAVVIATCMSAIVDGEKRLLVAVLITLPFVFVRLLYSILSVFDSSNPNFRQFTNTNKAGYIVLGMCTIMEIICVLIYEVVGMTLPYVPRKERSSFFNPNRATPRIDANGQPLGAYPPQYEGTQQLPQQNNSQYYKTESASTTV